MKRRSFLTAIAVLPAALIVPELIVPKRTFFLPPAGGWRPSDFEWGQKAMDPYYKTFDRSAFDLPGDWTFANCMFKGSDGKPFDITIDTPAGKRTFVGPDTGDGYLYVRLVTLGMNSPADALAKAGVIVHLPEGTATEELLSSAQRYLELAARTA